MTPVATTRRPLSEWSGSTTGTSARPRARTRADGAPRAQARRPAGAKAPVRPTKTAPTTARTAAGTTANTAAKTAARAQPAGRDPAELRRLAQAIPAAHGGAVPAVAPRRRPESAPPESSPRHLRVVAPRQRSTGSLRRRARVLVIVGSLAVTVVAFGLVYLHVLSAQRQFELDRLTSTEQAAQLRYQDLRTSVEADNSPARIMAEAGRLHLVEPTQIIPVRAVAGGTVTPAVNPAPVSGSTAPGGVANWSGTKPDLVGAP